ncbi:ubiquitin carboxyl-terminal hydrolase CYLD-like, partial [Pocillopora damicornis]|uniref:ubiquitin carboxyl-terminal hydrolase CYLD-like n=1 Tax=Pocillopora damicornis TaxID=46731 RepID=UPI000F557F35
MYARSVSCVNVPSDQRLTEKEKQKGNGHRLVRELMEQVTHLQAELGPSEEETNLLLAITLSEGRYETYIARKPMTFGRQLSPGSAVFVEVKGHSNVLPGIVRYKGVLPPIPGTWFGVELIKHPGSGTCDGTFRKKRYFTCEPDCGIFVGLDKLRPREDGDDLKSLNIARKEENIQGIDGVPKTDERVVTFIKDSPA